MDRGEAWRLGLDVLVAHLPVGVFITAPDGAVVYASERCAQLIGAAPKRSGGWAWTDGLHPEDRDRVVAAWELSGCGVAFAETYRVGDGQGDWRWLRVRADPARRDGELQAMIGVVEDITDLRELRQQHGDRQVMLDAVLTNSSDLVVVVDERGRLSFISAAAHRILGHDPDHWLGRDVFDLLHPDDIGRAAEAMATSMDSGPGVKEALELRVRHADGGWREVEIVANNLAHVEHVGGLVITARDVSERLRAQASADAARDRFEQAFDRAPIGMVLVANDGRMVRVNEALARMVGRSVQDLTGESMFSIAHPDDRDAAIARAVATLAEDDLRPIEVRVVRHDGRTAWARITATVIRDDHGAPQHTIAHIEDVTDQRQLQEQLERAAAHDPLTGLLNRAGFSTGFTRATRGTSPRPGALLLIDLDGFKAVNDAHGHAAGDELLVLIARRLTGSIRSEDLVGRLGGDEFAVYQPDVVDPAAVAAFGERIRTALAAPFRITAGIVAVSGSVGVALVDGTVALTRALASADAASYDAKRAGGDRVEVTRCAGIGHSSTLCLERRSAR